MPRLHKVCRADLCYVERSLVSPLLGSLDLEHALKAGFFASLQR